MPLSFRVFCFVAAVFLLSVTSLKVSGQLPDSRPKSANEQRVIEEGQRRLANFSMAAGRVELRRLDVFYVNELLVEKDAGIAYSEFSKGDALYRWFSQPEFQKEIQLSKHQMEKFGKWSSELFDKSKEVLSQFSKTGDLNSLNQFEKSVSEFDKAIVEDLSRQQMEAVKTVLLRSQILNKGLPEFLKRNQQSLKLGDSEVKEILAEARTAALPLHRDSNRKFLRTVQSLLPGYIKPFSEFDESKLPVLPLQTFLAVSEAPDLVVRSAENSVKQYKIDLNAGEWIFSGPLFQFKKSGDLKVLQFSNIQECPRLPMASFRRFVGAEWSDDQLLEFRNVLAEIEQRQKANPNIDPCSAESFQENKAFLERVKSVLLPLQLESISNYIRLHSLFTLGPQFIFEEADCPEFPDKKDFAKKLEESRDIVREIIDEASREFANELVQLIDKKMADLDPGENTSEMVLRSEHFVGPSQHVYERLLGSILESEDFRNGR